METYSVDSCVRGHHVSKHFWTPTIGETLVCKQEPENLTDPYAVAVMANSIVVGHVPRKISAACSLFLRRKESTIQCTITGKRRCSADLPQGGLEVPCKLKFEGHPVFVAKIKKLLSVVPPPLPQPNVSSELEPPNKKRKVANNEAIDVESMNLKNDSMAEPLPWLSLNNITLTEEDREIIVSGEELNDKHINFAQAILKQQFKGIAGLQSTLLLSGMKYPLPCGALQIVHVRGNHWIVASTISCAKRVGVFDSLYSQIDDQTEQMLTKVFGSDVTLEVEITPKQQGVRDCGVFAIAICTCIAHGQHPSSAHFSQSSMRDHLIQCYKDQYFTPFPTLYDHNIV